VAKPAVHARLGGFLVAWACSSCVSSHVPDPRDAARAFAVAAERGDADTLYSMLSASSQRQYNRNDIRKVVAAERGELADEARALAAPDLRVEAAARLRFADGEEAALDLREGRYAIAAAGALPGGARTPEEAIDQLRRVLARRSYSGLMRVLSPATRAAVESDMRSMVDGLNEPSTLPVQVTGDAAVVLVPGGHQIKLRREAGIWRVDDFD
jgi:hypothetical protein